MSSGGLGGDDLTTVLCHLTWRLVRAHGWASRIDVDDLARASKYTDEQAARDIIRDELTAKSFIGYHPGRDQVWIRKQEKADIRTYLIKSCGYSSLRVDATLESDQ